MSVYKRLAERLNALPQTFPPTENGIELKILEKIFLPEDAEMAAVLFRRRRFFFNGSDNGAARKGQQNSSFRRI